MFTHKASAEPFALPTRSITASSWPGSFPQDDAGRLADRSVHLLHYVRAKLKREIQILSVIDSTFGMVGDLQAIAGKAMPEISSLDTPLLEDATESQRKVG